MKKILIPFFTLCLLFYATNSDAMEAEFDYVDNSIRVTVKAESESVVTSRIISLDGTLIAVNQEMSDIDGNYTYSFVFDEEKRGDYTLRVSSGGEVRENTVYYSGREGCEFLMYSVKGVYGNISADIITIILPESVSLKNVVPVFEVSEYASVMINDEVQVSGVSSVDLDKDIIYTVTSGGGDTKEYKIVVKRKSDSSSGGGGGGGGRVSIPVSGVSVLPFPDIKDEEKTEIFAFDDVDKFHWAYTDIMELAECGIVSVNKSFEPERSITRAEFTKLAVLALGIYNPDAKCTFSDISDAPWSEAYVGSAVERGLVNGTGDLKFDFSAPISRQDAAVIIHRALDIGDMSPEFKDKAMISDYAFYAVGALKAHGVLKGDENGDFRPADSISRAEAATLIARVRRDLT